MPAFAEEGIQLRLLTAPARVLADNGRMTTLECTRMELGEPDGSGRRRPVPVDGSEFVVKLDTLLVAISEDPDLSFLGQRHGLELTRWGTPAVELSEEEIEEAQRPPTRWLPADKRIAGFAEVDLCLD